MRVSVERLPGSAVALDIAADDDEFNAAYEKTIRELRREAAVPGFRKGKAPRQILERMIGRTVLVQETNREMMQDLFREAMAQEGLVPVSEPDVELVQDDPLEFKVTVQVYPTIELGGYKDVRVEPREVDITDEEVETVIEQVRKNAGSWEPVDTSRQPMDGDQVVVDMSVYDGDDLFMPPAVDEEIVLGETPLFESVAEAIKMMMPGSSGELTLAFEEDDVTVGQELRGKTLRYAFTLKEIRERHVPDLDDELAKRISEYDTVEEMTGRIRRDLLRSKASETRAEVVNEIIAAMSDAAQIEVPSALVESEIEQEIQATSSRFAAQGLAYDDFLRAIGKTDEEYREGLRPDTIQRMRNSMVMIELSKAEALEVTDEDVDAEIERVVADSPNPERRRRLFDSEYFRNQLQNELFDKRLTERLIEIATEGKGAIYGPGADLLAAGPEPPPPPRATAVEENVAEGEATAEVEEAAETASADADEETTSLESEAEAEPVVDASLDEDAVATGSES